MAFLFLKISTVLYVLSAFAYLGHLLAPRVRTERFGLWLLYGAVVTHAVTIGLRWVQLGLTPVANFREALSWFAFSLAIVYLIIQAKVKRAVIGAFVTPLVVVAMISSVLIPQNGGPPPASLRSTWLPIHITMAFLGDASLAVAAAVAVLYLILEHKMKSKDFGGLYGRLPSLEALDALNYNLVRVGFVLLSLAIITGTLWAGRLWHSYFAWDPRQVSAILAWVLYAGLIVSRWIAGWRGRRAALITLLGFAVMIGSFVTLRMFDLGRHWGSFT